MTVLTVRNINTGQDSKYFVYGGGRKATAMQSRDGVHYDNFTRTGVGSARNDSTGVTYQSNGNGLITSSLGNQFMIMSRTA